MAPPALQPRLTRPCPPAPQVPCVRRALVGGASRAHSTSIAPRGSTPVVSSPLHAALRPPGDPSPSGLSTSDHPSSSTPTPGSRRSTCPVGSRPLLLGSRDSGESLLGGGGAPRGVAMRRHGVRRSHPAQRLPPRHLPCARPSPPRALAARALPRPERAGGRRWARWAQLGAGGLSGRWAALRPRSPEGSARPPRRGSASRLGLRSSRSPVSRRR